jgi:hypothetical protein
MSKTKNITIYIPSFQLEYMVYVPTFNIIVPTLINVPAQFMLAEINKNYVKQKTRVLFRYTDCKFQYVVNNMLYEGNVPLLDVYTPFTYTIDYGICEEDSRIEKDSGFVCGENNSVIVVK